MYLSKVHMEKNICLLMDPVFQINLLTYCFLCDRNSRVGVPSCI